MRKPDRIVKVNGEKITVFLSPFSETDYHELISFRHTYEKFGIMDNQRGTFKVYDFEKNHIPDINYLWSGNINFFNSIKVMGLAVLGFYAYRIARYKPSLSSFNTSAGDWDEQKKTFKDVFDLKGIFDMSNPNIVYNGKSSI